MVHPSGPSEDTGTEGLEVNKQEDEVSDHSELDALYGVQADIDCEPGDLEEDLARGGGEPAAVKT